MYCAPVGSLKFNDGAKNIHSPRGRGNKWLTLATSGKEKRGGGGEEERERKGEKGTSFKHIRERWCLKNNRARGARNRERGGEIKRRNESEGERERLVGRGRRLRQ